MDVPSLSGGSTLTRLFYRVLKRVFYNNNLIYLQLTPFTSRPIYIPPPYSSGPMMFDSLIADLLCVWLFSIYNTPLATIYHFTDHSKPGRKKYLISRLLLGSLNISTRQVGIGGADLTDGAHRFGGVGFRAFHLVHQYLN